MNRFGVSLIAVLTGTFAGCKDPLPQFDPELPEPPGNIVTLRGEDSAPAVTLNSPVFLKFDSDERFFYGVADAIRLEDDAVAIVNQNTSEILLFDSTGALKRSIGRRGSGPGEFQDVNSLVLLNSDTIVAFDRQARKAVLFTGQGDFVDEFRIDGPEEASPIGGAALIGALGRNQLLLWSQAMPTEREMNLPPNVPAGVPEVPFSVDLRGQSGLTLGKFPGIDQWITDASGQAVSYGPAPFGRRTWFGSLGDKAVVLRNTEPGFRVFRQDGTAHAFYHGAWDARKVTGRDRDRFMENWFTRLRQEPYWAKLRSMTEGAFPALTPYFRDAIVGTDAVVWIEPYESCCGDERLYLGYDSAGEAIGRLMLPARDRVLEIGNGVLIAARPQELGTETVYVQRYRMARAR